MIRDILGGTWKGDIILPSQLTITSEEKITKFLFRVKYDTNTMTFNGMFMLDPEVSEINEHANMVGELSENNNIMFEIRYSKFYFYTDQTEKEMISLSDNILTKVKFKGCLAKGDILFGSWESDTSIFEHEGQVRKTLPHYGTWWAKKQSALTKD
ncbi:MAG: hypothetical protein ABJF04_04825 [Reichenbachiella sp.]|uniref:hypothetical protein n=1 Tax=Reichenbachiella sp. TaxID=2184521 RepID=UPI0032654034